MKFYLGMARNWFWTSEEVRGVPVFVSHNFLKRRKTPFPPALTDWALDSGGFSELSLHGEWRTTPEEYVEAARRYQRELGHMDFAAQQDWMCEPFMIAKTGLSVVEHQKRTVENFLTLRRLAPDLPFAPVLQGWALDDYMRCLRMYADAGVDLAAEKVVGVGSVCRRQSTPEIGEIFQMLSGEGLKNLHGFGVKSQGLRRYGQYLSTADSMAWSFTARYAGKSPDCPKKNCANCLHYALEWRERLITHEKETP